MSKFILRLWCAALFALVPLAWAQANGGKLSGKVTTVQGNGIPNAAVTVTNVNSNASQKVLTGPDGAFSIPNLAPGTYRISVETAGYKRTTQQNIVLNATGSTPVNITLEAGNMNQTVEIKGHAPSIQTQSGEVSISIGSRMLRELPVIDRNQQQLVGLQTGITPPTVVFPLSVDPPRNRFFSADGQSPFVNLWLLDSLLNQEPYRGTAIRVIPEEATQQMDIETNSQEAHRGYNGGAVVTDLTAPGTNGIHGSLFEFNSGSWGRSRNYFDAQPTDSNPGFVYNQFGATIGGPIVKDKTFFFGSYEGTYANGAVSTIGTLPTPGVLTGNFSSIPGLTLYNPFTGTADGTGRVPFVGNVIPTPLINPAAASIAALLPAPNQAGLVNNFVANVPSIDHANKADGRIDEHFNDRTTAFVRYGYSNWHDYENSPLGPIIGSATRGALVGQNAILDGTREITDRLIGDVRIGYNRYDQHIGPYDNVPIPGTGFTGGGTLGIPGVTASPSLMGMNIAGLPGIGTAPYLPQNGVDNTIDGALTFSYHKGRNDIIFGTDDREIRSNGFTGLYGGNYFGPNGTAYFGPGATLTNNGALLSPNAVPYNSLAAFLTGAPNAIGAENYLTTPTVRQEEYSVWVGDRIQATSRLTFDFGVRYELFSPLQPEFAGGAQYFNATNNTFNYANVGGFYNSPTSWDTDNVAPRFGMAARITSKTVFRGGYSWNYFQLPYIYSGFMPTQYGTALGAAGTYAVAPLTTPFNGTFSPGPAPATPLVNGTSAGNLPVVVTPRSMDTPYVQNYSAQVQREFYWGTMLSVGYAGSTARHLPFFQQLNTTLPGAGLAAAPFAPLGRTASTLLYSDGLTDNYNSLQVSLVKRFSAGVSFIASYTWANALGYTDNNMFLPNAFNRSQDYGALPWDRQSVLTISHVWELPFGQHSSSHLMSALIGGWQLNGVFTWATGTPLSITADPLACNCANGTVMASLVPGVNPVLGSGVQYLNPAAFTSPAPGTFGNLNRVAPIFGPGMRNYDFSLFKDFKVHDRYNFELRGEAYDLTNTPHYLSPVTNINSPAFGQTLPTNMIGMTGINGNGFYNRQITVALRVTF